VFVSNDGAVPVPALLTGRNFASAVRASDFVITFAFRENSTAKSTVFKPLNPTIMAEIVIAILCQISLVMRFITTVTIFELCADTLVTNGNCLAPKVNILGSHVNAKVSFAANSTNLVIILVTRFTGNPVSNELIP